jgi:AmiR/NasT family two-component response regulator
MELKNKILLIEPDPVLSLEISSILKQWGYEITGSVQYIFAAINSIDKEKPDVIMIDCIINEQTVDFISKYVKLPLIIISNQFEREILKYSNKIIVLSIVNKPLNIYSLKVPVSIAFSKLANR